MFTQRERDRDIEREREKEGITSRFHAVGTEHDMGLELMNREIMT